MIYLLGDEEYISVCVYMRYNYNYKNCGMFDIETIICLFDDGDCLCLGEVLVWDLSKEDDLLLAASGIGEDAHREPVTRVHWLRDVSSKQRRYNV